MMTRQELRLRLAAFLAVEAIIIVLIFAFRPAAQAAPLASAGSTHAAQTGGLFLEPATQTSAAEPGDSATYTLALKNQLGAGDAFTLSLQPGNSWTTTLTITQTGVISDGEMIFFDVAVDVPPSAGNGDLSEATIQATSMTSPTITTTATIRTVAGGSGLAYVAMRPWHYLAIVEPLSLTLVQTVDLAATCKQPSAVAIPPDGATIWLACLNHPYKVVALDRESLAVLNGIPSSAWPSKISFSQDSQYAFVSSEYEGRLLIIDTQTFSTNEVNLPDPVRDTVAHPFRPLLYLSHSNAVSVMDTTTFAVVETIQTELTPGPLAISPDGNWLYVAGSYTKAISAIDTRLSQATAAPLTLAAYPGPMEPNQDGSKLFVTQDSGALAVVDTTSLTVDQYTTLDPTNHLSGPLTLDLTCNGQRVVVANAGNSFDPDGRQLAAVKATTYNVVNLLTMPDINQDGYVDWGAYSVALCPQHRLTGAILQPETQTNAGALGEVVTHQATLINQTGATDSFTITLGSHNWEAAPAVPVVGPLDHGDALTVTVYVTVPLNASWYQTDTVAITASPVTSPTVYSDTVTVTTQAYAPPQISQSPNALSATLLVGDAVTQTLLVSSGNGVTVTFEMTETLPTQSLLAWMAADDPLDGATILYDRTHNQHSFHDWTLRASLEAAGATIAENWAYPVNADVLAEADILWLSIHQMSAWAGSELEAVQEWLAAGGGLFLEGSEYYHNANPLANLAGITYQPLGVQDQITDGILSHPTTHGVSNIYVVYARSQLTITTPAEPVITVPDPYPGPPHTQLHMAAAEQKGGKVVALAGGDLYDGIINVADNLTLGENIFAWLAAPGSLDVPWLYETPTSGTLTNNSSQPISVTFDATVVQPGEYYANLRTDSNDPDNQSLTLPVTLTVQPTASMGWVEGTISDATTGDPLEATLIAIGEPYVVTSDPDTGHYQFWLESGPYTLEVTAEGYLTQTVPISITSQQGMTHNIALVLNAPVASPLPTSFAIEQEAGEITVETLLIENLGPAELTFQLTEQPALPWLALSPVSGDVPGYGSQEVDVTFNATGLQPGVYQTQIELHSNDPAAPLLLVPVTLTVTPNANMGQVTGTVTDAWTGEPLIATVELVGIYATTADPTYAIWAAAGGYMLKTDAPGYVTHSTTANITAGGTLVVNVALEPAQPRLTWSPAELTAIALQGQSVQQTLLLANTGPLPLQFTLNELPASGDVPWLSVAPAAGTIPGHDETAVIVTFNAAGLAAGVHEATLAVEHNDPNQPNPLQLPVSFEVLAPIPVVALSSNQAKSATVGNSLVYTFTVTNSGNAADTVTLSVNAAWNATLSMNNSGPLEPGDSFTFTLTVLVPYGAHHGASQVATITARSSLDQSVTDTAQATTTAAWLRIALPIIIWR